MAILKGFAEYSPALGAESVPIAVLTLKTASSVPLV
jgi:hypothetical protein